jgi:hypothetical protein
MNHVLYSDEEVPDHKPPPDAVIVEGVIRKFGFHPGRLLEKKEAIRELLRQLPDTFHKGKGEGWSFLALCEDREGRQWGEHNRCEDLMCLGLAVNMLEFCMKRDSWHLLPGGMPYVVVNTDIP